MLAGKKTYISAGLLALATFARTAGWLDEPTYSALQGLLAALGLAALRAGVGKVSEP